MSIRTGYGLLLILVCITGGIELIGSLYTDSLGLYSDAIHLGADSLPTLLGYFAAQARKRGEDVEQRENNLTETNIWLLAASGIYIAYHAYLRLGTPELVGKTMLWFAVAGFVGQGLQFLVIRKLTHHHAHAHTGLGQYLHFLVDFAAAGAVLLGAFIIYLGGSSYWDTAASFIVAIASFGAVIFLRHKLQKESDPSHTH